MTLTVNQETMTILGVPFQNKRIFDAVWYAIGSSMIENYTPTIEDVERMKAYAETKMG
ncbi:MAG: antitoxin VbhA family protein [Defluviitaleaceae bacterium]|nr:antitoxin VbhA family protein [Defluviitaleaceae bacterium]